MSSSVQQVYGKDLTNIPASVSTTPSSARRERVGILRKNDHSGDSTETGPGSARGDNGGSAPLGEVEAKGERVSAPSGERDAGGEAARNRVSDNSKSDANSRFHVSPSRGSSIGSLDLLAQVSIVLSFYVVCYGFCKCSFTCSRLALFRT